MKFISDFGQTAWEQILCTGKSDVKFSMNQYLSKIDGLLEVHATLNKKELKGFQNSIKKLNKMQKPKA